MNADLYYILKLIFGHNFTFVIIYSLKVIIGGRKERERPLSKVAVNGEE